MFQLQKSSGIFAEQLLQDVVLFHQAPQRTQGMPALTSRTLSEAIVAITSKNQFVLMPKEEFTCVVFIPLQGVQSRTGGKVSMHVGVIR